MLTADEMPEDNAQLADLEVEFHRLEPDSPASCSQSIDELLEYLHLEVPDGETLGIEALTFLRTALVDQTRYWIWTFNEPDGGRAYATASIDATGRTTVGYDDDYYGLTPEQFILGDYHQVF